MRIHRPGKRRRRSFSEADYAALVSAAHQYLHAPITLVWDQLNTPVSVAMRAFVDAHSDWLSVYSLPSYAPDPNPVEVVWTHLKSSVANLAACGLDSLASLFTTRLKRLQYRPTCLHGFLAETGPDPRTALTPAIQAQ